MIHDGQFFFVTRKVTKFKLLGYVMKRMHRKQLKWFVNSYTSLTLPKERYTVGYVETLIEKCI